MGYGYQVMSRGLAPRRLESGNESACFTLLARSGAAQCSASSIHEQERQIYVGIIK